MTPKIDTIEAMRFLASMRDRYSEATLRKEAAECELMIAKVQGMIFDPRLAD